MALDLQRLELVKRLADGTVKARCPACAESGGDRKGVHLLIHPDERYGCCVHPKDRQHRKRIFALAGDHKPRPITVKVETQRQAVVSEIDAALNMDGTAATLRTAIFYPRAYARAHTCEKDLDLAVLSVAHVAAEPPETPSKAETAAETPVEGDEAGGKRADETPAEVAESSSAAGIVAVGPVTPADPNCKLPYLDADGVLIVPFGAPERYSWWADGQTAQETIEEVKQRMKAAEQGCDY